MNEALTFMHDYCDFSDPNWVWIMTGISRNKDNTESGDKFLRRMVITKPEDIEAFTASIDVLIQNRKLRMRLGSEGRKWAQNFSWKTISERQISFYEQVFESKS